MNVTPLRDITFITESALTANLILFMYITRNASMNVQKIIMKLTLIQANVFPVLQLTR